MFYDLVKFNVKSDQRGCLTIIDGIDNLPFEPKRLFYVHNPTGLRGGHAHRKTIQLIFSLAGQLDIKLDNGKASKLINLNNPHEGILIHPMVWSEQLNFSDNCIYAVLASTSFDEKDYIRNREEFDRLSK